MGFLKFSRYLAVLFALGLGVGETVLNWGHWQYAPLWIVDYFIAVWLLWSVWRSRNGQGLHHLLSAWAFTAGVFYIALFVNLEPEYIAYSQPDVLLLWLMGFMLVLSILGFVTALWAVSANHIDQGTTR